VNDPIAELTQEGEETDTPPPLRPLRQTSRLP
jgi:hypothetical protein